MSADFRALCADLLWALENAIRVIYHEDGTKHISTANPIVNRARAALGEADEPAVPESREPAAVTKQPSDAEQVLRLAAIIREVDGNHSKGAAALAESILDHPGFRVVLASWGTSNLTQTKLSPAAGEVAELVEMLKGIAYWRLHGTDKPTPFDIRQAALLTRAAELLQRQALVPVPVSDALIKAECALSDIAEGEPMTDEGDPLKWAERRCADTLAIIRPTMMQHKIRTSEWPPVAATAKPLPEVDE